MLKYTNGADTAKIPSVSKVVTMASSGGESALMQENTAGGIDYYAGSGNPFETQYLRFKNELDKIERFKNGDTSVVLETADASLSDRTFPGRITIKGGEVTGDIDAYEEWLKNSKLPDLASNADKVNYVQGHPTNYYSELSKAKSNDSLVPSDSGAKTLGSTTSSLRLDSEHATAIANKIVASAEAINDIWRNAVVNDVDIINNSWASTDAQVYVDKLMEENDRINSTISALKLLANTYEKVAKQGDITEQDVGTSVRNI